MFIDTPRCVVSWRKGVLAELIEDRPYTVQLRCKVCCDPYGALCSGEKGSGPVVKSQAAASVPVLRSDLWMDC